MRPSWCCHTFPHPPGTPHWFLFRGLLLGTFSRVRPSAWEPFTAHQPVTSAHAPSLQLSVTSLVRHFLADLLANVLLYRLLLCHWSHCLPIIICLIACVLLEDNLYVLFIFVFLPNASHSVELKKLLLNEFFLIEFIYLFIYLFMAALGLRCCARAFSSCSEQGILFVVVRGLPIAVASLVAEHRL